jgi:hypothetical protein
MKKIIACLVLFAGCAVQNAEIDKIIFAKEFVRSSVNYPDTLDFHDMKTDVRGNTVSLTFTAKNGFGVPETHTMNVNVP